MTEQPTEFKIDACYSDQLAQFASRMEHVSPDLQHWMETAMNDTESKAFYKGLMAGYGGAFALLQQIPASEVVARIHDITAFLAAKVRRMKSIDLPGEPR